MAAPLSLQMLGLPPLPPELAALASAPSGEEDPNHIVRQAFRLGHMRLLAPFDVSSELVEMPDVYPLPRMPANLLGLVNLHGRILPLFETQHTPREKRMVLVIGHGNDAAGIVIDGLPRRMVFKPESRILPPALPATVAAAAADAYVHGEDTWYEFNYTQLLEQIASN